MPRITNSQHVQKRWKNETGFPIVEILWNDAQDLGSSWLENSEGSIARTTTVGYLTRETPESVTLVQIINENHISGGIVIPVGCIVSRRNF